MTITSALFCYDLTTTFPYTPGLHISLCGHFCSHSSLPPMIGIITFPTNLHRQHISYSPILTSHHHALHIKTWYQFHIIPNNSVPLWYVIYTRSKDNVHHRPHLQFHYTLLFHKALLHDFIILPLGYYSSFGLSWQQRIEELYRTGVVAVSCLSEW